jgi:hypothetical protein
LQKPPPAAGSFRDRVPPPFSPNTAPHATPTPAPLDSLPSAPTLPCASSLLPLVVKCDRRPSTSGLALLSGHATVSPSSSHAQAHAPPLPRPRAPSIAEFYALSWPVPTPLASPPCGRPPLVPPPRARPPSSSTRTSLHPSSSCSAARPSTSGPASRRCPGRLYFLPRARASLQPTGRFLPRLFPPPRTSCKLLHRPLSYTRICLPDVHAC